MKKYYLNYNRVVKTYKINNIQNSNKIKNTNKSKYKNKRWIEYLIECIGWIEIYK